MLDSWPLQGLIGLISINEGVRKFHTKFSFVSILKKKEAARIVYDLLYYPECTAYNSLKKIHKINFFLHISTLQRLFSSYQFIYQIWN